MTVEDELFDRLRANSLDLETRSVYADWLEGHGFVERAAFLRATDLAARRAAALAAPEDARWRAVVTLQPLSRCGRLYRQGCGIAWEQHARTADDAIRQCTTCNRSVYYYATLDELVHGPGAIDMQRCFTTDLALDEDAAKDRYDAIVST